MTNKNRTAESQAFWAKIKREDLICDALGKGIDLTNMADVVARWNDLTDEERKEASAISAEAAASRYTEVLMMRAMGFDFDYRTNEFVKTR